MCVDDGGAGDDPPVVTGFCGQVRCLLWIFSRLASDPWVAVHGVCFVEDLAHMPLRDLVRFVRGIDQHARARLQELVSDVLPLRMNRFYLLHAPLGMRAALAVARPFMSKKIAARMVPATAGQVLRELGPAALPEALGGSLCQDGAGWLNACTETDQSGVFYIQEWRRG
jgi:hypothetical protein